MQRDPDMVMGRARTLSATSPKLPAARVLQAMLSVGVVSNNTLAPQSVVIK